MKNKNIILFGCLLMGVFCLISCDKYKSEIRGKVFFTDVNDNIEYPAAGAVVTKMVQKNDSLHLIVAVFADANGEFLFDHTTKGTWILSGKFDNDTVSYFGLSESFTTNGEDKVEKNITLKHIIREDWE